MSKPIRTGLDVVHLSPQSGQWQRGKVLGAVGDEVELAYWDYPGIARVDVSILRPLLSVFTQLPAQLVQVCCSKLPINKGVGELTQLGNGSNLVKKQSHTKSLGEMASFKRAVLAMIVEASCET